MMIEAIFYAGGHRTTFSGSWSLSPSVVLGGGNRDEVRLRSGYALTR